MKLKSLFNAVISKGIAQDPRGKARVEQELKRLKKDYAELSSSEQKEFDPERLTNPYSDTRILHGSGEEEIRSILVGIDIDVGEVLLAHTLRGQNKKIDLILAHHPEGRALAALHQVMYMQADIACLRGVPVTVADKLLQERIDEVERRLLPVNHTKTADAARLLDIPLMCCHTPADNHVSSFLQRLFEKKGPETVKEIMNIIKEIPEYR
ncbi:MAG: NGG1p interacting factor NIF3, partial [Candidatus Omnitrophica bacterium]|nr:NGG1p interacting factor NIF3 [Candidatus Omnitrophota bacterium]